MLQICADIYCDTRIAVQLLERLHPEPTLFPGDSATVWGPAHWAETSFPLAVTAPMGFGGTFDEACLADRQKMTPHVDFSRAPDVLATKLLQLRANLDRFERQLGDVRRFLLGSQSSLANFAAYRPLSFLGRHPETAPLVAEREPVSGWLDRVAAIGEGKLETIPAGTTIEIAAAAAPQVGGSLEGAARVSSSCTSPARASPCFARQRQATRLPRGVRRKRARSVRLRLCCGQRERDRDRSRSEGGHPARCRWD